MPKFHETHRDCGKHEGEGVVVGGLIARKLFELIAFATVHEQCMKAYSSILTICLAVAADSGEMWVLCALSGRFGLSYTMQKTLRGTKVNEEWMTWECPSELMGKVPLVSWVGSWIFPACLTGCCC